MSQPSQHWQADDYARHARFVSDYGNALLDVLQAQPHERVLDLGCGDGVLTAKIAASGCRVLGVDGSADLVAAARRLGVDAVQADGQRLAFDAEFDAVFSNAALHWMTDAPAVVSGLARALKPGGRLVAEFGGAGNIAVIQAALEQALAEQGLSAQPCWYFPTAAAYCTLLAQHGLSVLYCETYARPTPLPTGVAGWLAAFAAPMLPAMSDSVRERVLTRAAEQAEAHLPRENGLVLADYVRLRCVAVKR